MNLPITTITQMSELRVTVRSEDDLQIGINAAAKGQTKAAWLREAIKTQLEHDRRVAEIQKEFA